MKSAGQLLLLRHCCIGMQRADPSHFKSISFEIGQFANESWAEEDDGFCQRPPFTPQKVCSIKRGKPQALFSRGRYTHRMAISNHRIVAFAPWLRDRHRIIRQIGKPADPEKRSPPWLLNARARASGIASKGLRALPPRRPRNGSPCRPFDSSWPRGGLTQC